MNEYEMACEVRKRIEQFGKIIDGVYIFNIGGKFGTVKNYQQDEEHWEVMFDNLTHEQVIELFEGAGTCHMRLAYEEEDADGFIWPDHYECDACGVSVNGIMPYYDTEIPPKFCPNCGRRVVRE